MTRPASDAPPTPHNTASPHRAVSWVRTAARAAFTLTACLTFVLGVWRLADPPATQTSAIHRGVSSPSTTNAQTDHSNGSPLTLAARGSAPRDTTLIASLALTVVLGLGLVLLTPTGKRGDP